MIIVLWIIASLIGYVVGATLMRTLFVCSRVFENSYQEDELVNIFTVIWPVGIVVFVGWFLFNISVLLTGYVLNKTCPNKSQD